MKRCVGLVLAFLMAVGLGCAMADLEVQLPAESRYSVIIPEGMEYDGPGAMDKAAFAYVSGELGLDIVFTCSDGSQVRYLDDLIPTLQERGMEEVQPITVNDIPMIAYRYTPDDPAGMRCIAYIFQDGSQFQEIAFWYATQEAADLTKTIMESIR